MKFKGDVMRAVLLACGVVMGLASCGGGTQVEAFVPKRVIAFGDENSLVNPDGSKYTVNAIEMDTAVPPAPLPGPVLLCTGNPIWVQQLAYSYGLAFQGACPGTTYTANGKMMAQLNATVATLETQIATDFLVTAADSFGDKDLVTIMVGLHDIVAAYEVNHNADATAVAAAANAGRRVGAQVVKVTDLGAKVLVATVPDVGLTPYAVTQDLAYPGAKVALTALSQAFNDQLRLKLQDVRNGGRSVALILASETVLAMARTPSTYGLTNVTEAACLDTAPLPACTTLTLKDTTSASELPTTLPATTAAWLWADAKHLGPVAQARIGDLATTRARGNPF